MSMFLNIQKLCIFFLDLKVEMFRVKVKQIVECCQKKVLKKDLTELPDVSAFRKC